MATMKEVYNEKSKFNTAVLYLFRFDDDDPNNSDYTPTLKKALDDIVSAYKRATSELEYRRAQREENIVRQRLHECENHTRVLKTIFNDFNKGVDEANNQQ